MRLPGPRGLRKLRITGLNPQSIRNPQSASELLRPVPDVAARVPRALPIVASAARLGSQPAGDAFSNIARAGMLGAIVLGAAHHRAWIFVRNGRFARLHGLFSTRFGVDVAENALLYFVLRQGSLLAQNNRKAGASDN